MEPETIKAFSEIATEAVKILGPAWITAFVGIKIGKLQLDSKIKEIEKNNEFKAREHLFKYAKDWQSEMDKRCGDLMNTLETIDGLVSIDDTNEIGMHEFLLNRFNMYLKEAPYNIEIALREMEPIKSKYGLEFDRLFDYKEKVKNIKRADSLENLRSGIILLTEIYGHLSRCAYFTSHEEAMKALKPYLKD